MTIFERYQMENDGITIYETQNGDSIALVESSIDIDRFNSWIESNGYDKIIENTNGEYLDAVFGSDRWDYMENYVICDECHKAIYIRDYGKPNYHIFDWYCLCGDCIRENPRDYISSLVDNPQNCNMILSKRELENAGFTILPKEYEYGWYGITDNPVKILAKAKEVNPDAEFIFHCESLNPFATYFSLCMR